MFEVGFLGLGTMGGPMARNLAAAGHRVRAWNRTRERADKWRGDGGPEVVGAPADAGKGADVVFVCLADDGAVRQVLLGDGGVVRAMRPGAVLIDCSTTSLDLTERISAAADERGVAFVDAPMTGSKSGAESGRLTFMVGGRRETVGRIAPLLSVVGSHVVHVGDWTGAGQAAKICLNMAQAVMLEGLLEGFALGERLGVPLAKLAEIYEHSAARSGVGTFKTPHLFRGDFAPHFRLCLMQKDLHLALSEAGRRRVPLPLARQVTTIYDQAAAEGFGDEDFLATARLLARWTRTRLRDPEALGRDEDAEPRKGEDGP